MLYNDECIKMHKIILYVIAGCAVLFNVQIAAYGDELSTNRAEQNTTTKRRVPSGVETMVARTFAWRAGRPGGLCSEYYTPALQIVDPPQHGTVRLDSVLATPRGSGCPNPIHGQGVFYRSAEGYVGQDSPLIAPMIRWRSTGWAEYRPAIAPSS